MKKRQIQQKTERRISAATRLAMVAVLLVAQIALVVLLSTVLHQKMYLAYTGMELLAFVYAIVIYNREGSDTYKMVWILLILAVPVVGLILYWLWNGNRQSKRLDLKKIPAPTESKALLEKSQTNLEKLRGESSTWAKLAAMLEGRGFLLYRNTRAVYLPSGEAYLEDLLQKMEQAEHFIFLEYFIVVEGQVWDRMMDIFREKTRQGVEIRLLFDDFGSMMRMHEETVEEAQALGVDMRVFNPVHHYVNRIYFNYRDHRKIAVIDGHIAYTGGANLADEYANLIERFGYWKDCGVRLEGEGCWGLTREFIYLWERVGGSLSEEHDYYRPHNALTQETGYCQPMVDGPDNNPIATAEDMFLQLISLGRRQVYITTPYLAIDEPMIRALCLAADSGVDVRLMMPGIPDHKFAYLVAECYFGQLLEHGVHIYNFEPGLLHGKSVMVDEEVAFVGSVNMDFRSFQLHFECGTMLYHMPAVKDLQSDMEQIMERSHALTYEEWKNRIWYRKVMGVVLKLFAMWM
ncbi:MAG: cardiolipin synthase [Clostridiales bacterium]|nr:cardiolipin synthase [Clostridiales bacterium]